MNPRDTSGCSQNPSQITKSRRLGESKSRRPFFRSLLGLYLQHFGQVSKSYGTLGAVAALLLWFYISSAAILIGAEVNVQLLKAAHDSLPVKEVPKAEAGSEPPVRLVG
jgi:Virulence factor BrkB